MAAMHGISIYVPGFVLNFFTALRIGAFMYFSRFEMDFDSWSSSFAVVRNVFRRIFASPNAMLCDDRHWVIVADEILGIDRIGKVTAECECCVNASMGPMADKINIDTAKKQETEGLQW